MVMRRGRLLRCALTHESWLIRIISDCIRERLQCRQSISWRQWSQHQSELQASCQLSWSRVSGAGAYHQVWGLGSSTSQRSSLQLWSSTRPEQRLFQWIKSYSREYNTNICKDNWYEHFQDVMLDKFVFKGQVKNGFFVEAGAFDFIFASNSLMFELKYGWTGLLVEAHPFYYPLGLKVGRKAWAAPVCLGTERR